MRGVVGCDQVATTTRPGFFGTCSIVLLCVAGFAAGLGYAQDQPRVLHAQPTVSHTQTMKQAKTDCEALLNSVLPFAEQVLRKHGEFYPYGGAMRTDGQIISVGGDSGSEQPKSIELIELLKSAFIAAAQKGEYKATALVTNSSLTISSTGEKTDAIVVSLDHRDDYSVIVMFPYTITNGKLVMQAPIAQKGAGDVFRAH